MQDCWYADNRDLIKWGVLFRLAESYDAPRILQLAYYRPSSFDQLIIDDESHEIPEEVIAHFRNLRTIERIDSEVRVTVFDLVFKDRPTYLQEVLTALPIFSQERCIVFLDPDTGLESTRPSLDHVLNNEAGAIWNDMKIGDVFVFYQHQTNRSGQSWIEPKRNQLADALNVDTGEIRMANAPKITKDVVFFFTQKT
ncbi:MAG: hypothetical protein O7G85_00405 [Planctomycetota bacterium]|nr:hypothetical protein [Planctomycetota bacterium]